MQRVSIIVAQSTSYRYDALGNLLSVDDGATEIEYIIGPFGRRVGKKSNGIHVQGFVYKDQLNPVAELDGNNNVISEFVYGSQRYVPDYMIRSGTTYRIISDHLGSVRLAVNTSDGSIAQRIDYDEFGKVLQDTNPGFQPLGFAGGLYDFDTGLVRFGFRDYDPKTGRWSTKDPILFDGGQANFYVYVDNNPINYFDPDGLKLVNKSDKSVVTKPETGKPVISNGPVNSVGVPRRSAVLAVEINVKMTGEPV